MYVGKVEFGLLPTKARFIKKLAYFQSHHRKLIKGQDIE